MSDLLFSLYKCVGRSKSLIGQHCLQQEILAHKVYSFSRFFPGVEVLTGLLPESISSSSEVDSSELATSLAFSDTYWYLVWGTMCTFESVCIIKSYWHKYMLVFSQVKGEWNTSANLFRYYTDKRSTMSMCPLSAYLRTMSSENFTTTAIWPVRAVTIPRASKDFFRWIWAVYIVICAWLLITLTTVHVDKPPI